MLAYNQCQWFPVFSRWPVHFTPAVAVNDAYSVVPANTADCIGSVKRD